MAHDVFISYSIKDKSVADALCYKIEEKKIKCWIAPRDVRPGYMWANEIADAIPRCQIMLLIFSNSSNSSVQVLREVELAVKNKLIIVPVKIEDIMPSGGMAYYLSATHWIDAVGKSLNKKTDSLISTLKQFLDSSDIETTEVSAITKDNADALKKTNTKKKIWVYALIALSFICITALIYFSITTWFPDILSSADGSSTPEPTDIVNKSNEASITYFPEDFGYKPEQSAEIYDPGLKNCIKLTLEANGYTVEDDITIGDMFNLQELVIISDSLETKDKEIFAGPEIHVIQQCDIQYLWGLEYAKNLEVLIIEGNIITDISTISMLTKLRHLSFRSNDISYIDTLSSLSSLTDINLSENNITQIQPLSEISALVKLNLSHNNITDISFLRKNVNLEELDLTGNPISDLSPLGNLAFLRKLIMNYIDFSKITGLNTLHTVSYLSITNSNITDLSAISEMTQLTHLYIDNNTIEASSGLEALTNLEELSIKNTSIILPENFDNLQFLTSLKIDEKTYNENIELMKMLEDRGCLIAKASSSLLLFAPSNFDLSGDEIIKFIDKNLEVSLLSIFNENENNIEGGITIEDMFSLRTLILHPIGTTINVDGFEGWTELQPLNIAQSAEISAISSLKYAKNLYVLILDGFEIEELSSLASLPNLTYLSLRGNSVTDISSIENLLNLEVLYLDDNYIEDISALGSLSNLKWLGLARNYIDDISALEQIKGLQFLDIDESTYSSNTETVNKLIESGCQVSGSGS